MRVSMTELAELERNIGYTFSHRELLVNALTHPSCQSGINNQRLEFLGDAVLQICISDVLYRNHTTVQEGALTNLRQHLVCQDALAQVARKIGLGRCLLLGKSCEMGNGRENDSVLSDAMEAVLAAVYLDGGFDSAKKCIDHLWPIGEEEEFSDAKSALQEYLQKNGESQPQYAVLNETGPDHMKQFTVAVILNNCDYAHGVGASKKKAEQSAAREAMKRLKAEKRNAP